MPAVPAAPREDRHEPDEDGAKSEVIADKEPCKAFNTRALEAAKGKIALTPTYLKYLNLGGAWCVRARAREREKREGKGHVRKRFSGTP